MKKTDKKSIPDRGTTNYPFGPHKFFCQRCLKYHGVCPKSGKRKPSKGCNL